MRQDETILVFPGGGREIAKFKGEENTVNWRGRSGFARVAITGGYPIGPVALVGSDEMYHSLVSRDSRWGRRSLAATEKLTGRAGTPMLLVRGIGLTLIPRPQRMYLRFGAQVETATPDDVSDDEWVATVKHTAQTALETMLSDLLKIRENDPYRALNLSAWRHAALPASQGIPPASG